MQHQLKDVQHMQASSTAFAAILGDGSVVTWGKATDGGDSRAEQHQLKNVQQSRFRLPAALLPPFLLMDLSSPGEMLPTVVTVVSCGVR